MIFSSPEAALLELASTASLCSYDDALVAEELATIVPHLHPTGALMRFAGLRQSNDALTKVMAWSGSGSQTLRDAAAKAVEYQEGLVAHRLRQMFTPTVAYNDDGSRWSAPVVAEQTRAVAA